MDEKIIRLLLNSHYGKIPLQIDASVRHKWPDEKPDKDGNYLIRIVTPSESVLYRLRTYEGGNWREFNEYITHWWELPEVKE